MRDGNKERPRLELQPHRAPVVARIFRKFLAGAGLKGIARALNTEGILAPEGKKCGRCLVELKGLEPSRKDGESTSCQEYHTVRGNLAYRETPFCKEGPFSVYYAQLQFRFYDFANVPKRCPLGRLALWRVPL